MKRRFVIGPALVAAILIPTAIANAHDLFLRPFSFFVSPGTEVKVGVISGTFDRSENAVVWNRLRDLSLVTPSGRRILDSASWTAKGDTSTFTIRAGTPGTYVIGASTLPRIIRLSGAQFSEYLKTDGLPDILESRRKTGALGDSAVERYSKHVKAMLQVGSRRTSGFRRVLGYPAELVAINNPYSLKAGATFQVRALVGGQPALHQLLLFGGKTSNGATIVEDTTRTDGKGSATVRLEQAGVWYVKFISMAKVAHDSVDYESKWATLTFEVR